MRTAHPSCRPTSSGFWLLLVALALVRLASQVRGHPDSLWERASSSCAASRVCSRCDWNAASLPNIMSSLRSASTRSSAIDSRTQGLCSAAREARCSTASTCSHSWRARVLARLLLQPCRFELAGATRNELILGDSPGTPLPASLAV
jgi:hypothetical protein